MMKLKWGNCTSFIFNLTFMSTSDRVFAGHQKLLPLKRQSRHQC